jgi:hypothetical protein
VGTWIKSNPCFEITDVQIPCAGNPSYNCIVVNGDLSAYSSSSFSVYGNKALCEATL